MNQEPLTDEIGAAVRSDGFTPVGVPILPSGEVVMKDARWNRIGRDGYRVDLGSSEERIQGNTDAPIVSGRGTNERRR